MMDQLDRIIALSTNETVFEMATVLHSTYQMMANSLAGELDDFTIAINYLIDGRLSPHLINVKDLEQSFTQLLDRAKAIGLKPVDAELNVLFRHKAIVPFIIGTEIKLFVSVPFYQDEKATVYKYITFPLPLTESLSVFIQPNLPYGAWTNNGERVIEFDQEFLRTCEEIQDNWICPVSIPLKRAKASCVHNLYHQSSMDLEQSCPIEIGMSQDFNRRVSPNLYRLFETKPTILTQECADPKNSVITNFVGETFLNLTWDCPTAETADFTFYYAPMHMATGANLQKTLTGDMKKWVMKIIPEELQATAEQIILESTTPDGKIILPELRKRLKNYTWEKIKEATHYAAILAIFVCVTTPLTWVYYCLMNCKNKRKTKKCKPTIIRVPHHQLKPLAEKMMEMETVKVLE